MSESKKVEAPNWKDAAAVLVFRVCDSGHVAWLLMALFVLGGMWTLTRNLNSKDTLTLLSTFGTAKGWAWLGWLVAILEIPIAAWVIAKKKSRENEELRRLQGENAKARRMLKGYVQGELALELEKSD